MATFLSRGDILQELKLDAANASADVYSQFIQKIIEHSILPRKISIQNVKGSFEIVVNKGKIAGFRKFGAQFLTWVRYPLSDVQQHALDALPLSAGDALKDGEISLSLVTKRERAKLVKHEAPIGKVGENKSADPFEMVSANDLKQDENQKTAKTTTSLVLSDFFTSIQSKVKFVYMEDETTGQVQTSGVSGVIDADISISLKPIFLKWREAILGALGSGPQFITMGSPSGGGASLCCAVDGSHYLLAEIETKNFGVVAGLWIKTSQTK